jgi:alanine dehydrogenase
MVGEGRLAPAGLVMTARARPAAAVAAGSMREEATLHLEGLRGGAGSLAAASAVVAQAPSLLLAGGGALVGAEAFQVAADLRADVGERTMVIAANRLIGFAAAAIVIGTALALMGIIHPADLLLGIGEA